MGQVFTLPTPAIAGTGETIHELETLLEEARQGQITGIAYVALGRGSAFSIQASGRARLMPTYSVGAVHVLLDYLTKLAGH